MLEEAPALLALLRWAVGRRDELAPRLARALDRPLALGRRWNAWREALEAALDVDDAAAQAWALHQLGTRAYALGDADTAISLLEQALELRSAARRRRGRGRHTPQPGLHPPRRPTGGRPRRGARWPALAG